MIIVLAWCTEYAKVVGVGGTNLIVKTVDGTFVINRESDWFQARERVDL